MKESLLYQKNINGAVNCNACHHNCQISPGVFGLCGVRKNLDGVLYSLNYGKIIAEHVDSIEKKPLYHFLPGSLAYSIATTGCNFSCLHCQNADISQSKNVDEVFGEFRTPQEIVEAAIKSNCQSIAYTYTEPTIFVEFALETMKLATARGLKNVWVSNGYFSKQCFDLIKPYLNAINIDLKFFNKESYQKVCGAKLEPVLENLILVYQAKIHLEVTTLIIPGLNDSLIEIENIANFIKNKLSAQVPWHLSAFHPAYKLTETDATPTKTIIQAHAIAKKQGLNYVYAGNI